MEDAHQKHGDMNITVQEQTFHAFLRIITWIGGLIVVLLLFLALFNG